MDEDISVKLLEAITELGKSQKTSIWKSVSLSFILSVFILATTVVISFRDIQRDVQDNKKEIKAKASREKVNDKLRIINFNFIHVKDSQQIIYPIPLLELNK
jgi:hypothetical protein